MAKLITVHNRHSFGEWKPRKAAGTVVLEQPDTEYVLRTLSSNVKNLVDDKIAINIGAAFLHGDDQMNKKAGRAMAIKRMAPVQFSIYMQVRKDRQALWLSLEGIDVDLKVRYIVVVKIYRDDRKLRVMGVSTEEVSELPSSEI